jgi:hypothetical protein
MEQLERERLESEQLERERERLEREQLQLYIQEAQARLLWKQSLRTANMEAAANRYGTRFQDR